MENYRSASSAPNPSRAARKRFRFAIAGGLLILAAAVAMFGNRDYAIVAAIVAGIYALKAFLPW